MKMVFLLSILILGSESWGQFVGSGPFVRNQTNQALGLPVSGTHRPCFDRDVKDVSYSSLDNRLAVVGDFSLVGPCSGHYTVVDSSAKKISGFSELTEPVVGGVVAVSIPDGSGGWYIGGEFLDQDGLGIRNLAHVLPDGSLDVSFVYQVYGKVYDLTLIDDNLFVFGEIQSVGSKSYGGAFSINTITGVINNTTPSFNSEVSKAVVAPDNDLIVTGIFTNVNNDSSQNYLFSFNPTSRAVVEFPFSIGDGYIEYAISDGAGGYFIFGSDMVVNGEEQKYLFRVLSNGQVDPAFQVSVNGNVGTAISDGTNLYIGGVFSLVNGLPRSNLAAIEISTGQVTSFAPNPDRSVESLLIQGGFLYVGGQFLEIAGTNRSYLAQIELSTGNLTSWDSACDERVYDLKTDGSFLYVGGSFENIGGENFPSLARINFSNGTADLWDTKITTGTVVRMSITGARLFVASGFLTANAQFRDQFAEFSLVDGSLQPMTVEVDFGINGVLAQGNRLFVVGSFEEANSVPRRSFLEIDLTTDTAVSSFGFDGYVYSIFSDGANVGVVGDFSNAYGASGISTRIAKFEPNTGTLRSFSVDMDGSFNYDLAISNDENFLFVVGYMSNIAGQPRDWAGKISLADGSLDAWNISLDGTLEHILPIGDSLILAGDFTIVQGNSAPNGLAKVSQITGNFDSSWDPSQVSTGPITFLDTYSGDVLIGSIPTFERVGGVLNQISRGITIVDADTGALVQSQFSDLIVPNRSVHTFSESGGKFLVGGDFSSVKSLYRPGFAAIDTGTDQITDFTISIEGGLERIVSAEVVGDAVYIGFDGQFLNGVPRSYLAAFNKFNKTVLPFAPAVDSPIYKIKSISPTTIGVVGEFTEINGTSTTGFAILDSTNGSLLSPSYSFGFYGFANDFVIDDDRIIFYGYFNQVNGAFRSGMVAVDAANGVVDNAWNPDLAGFTTDTAALASGQLFISGEFDEVNGQPRLGIASVSPDTGATNALTIVAELPQYSSAQFIPTNTSSLFLMGAFRRVNGVVTNSVALIDPVTGVPSSTLFPFVFKAAESQSVQEIIEIGSDLYFFGDFYTTDGLLGDGVQKIDKNTGALSW